MRKEDSSKIIAFRPRVRKPPPESVNVEYEEVLEAPRWVQNTVYSLFSAVIGFFLVVPFLSGDDGSDPIYLIISLVFAMIAWVVHLFFTLKIRMDPEQIQFGFYLFAKKIPYDNIVDCSVIRYKVVDYLGWGIRKGREGITMYNVPGDQQIAVKLVVREEDGRKEYAFSAKRPQVICKRLQIHMGQRTEKPGGMPKKPGEGVLSRNY